MWTDWHIVPIMPSFCTINANKTRAKCNFICSHCRDQVLTTHHHQIVLVMQETTVRIMILVTHHQVVRH